LKIINRIGRKVYWRTFKADDDLHMGGLKSGDLESGAETNVGMGHDQVQMEIKESVRSTFFLPSYAGRSIHAASTSEKFSNRGTVILAETGRPVAINQKVQELMNPGGVLSDKGDKSLSQPEISLHLFLNTALALVDGLVAGYAQPSLILGGGKTGVGLAGVIISMFESAPEPQFPDLTMIADTLNVVLDEHDAHKYRAHILAAAEWFDRYVRKSASLSQGTATENVEIDLTPYDRAQFLDELNDKLDGVTDFKGAMDILENNRDIRKHVIAEYILGIGLRLNLERISLLVKQEKQPLDIHDIDTIRQLAKRYDQTLKEAEEDFVAMRAKIFRDHPLIDPKYIIDEGLDQSVRAYVTPQPEVEKLVKGINMKYLKGDRWLIRKTRKSLKLLIEELEHFTIGAPA
jgi:hypothetical protein